MRFHLLVPLWSALSVLTPTFALACSSCGCTLNSDWTSQGYAVDAGLRVDLRFDYFNQSELRSGSGQVDRASLELPHEEEIQKTTVNRNSTLGIDYAPSHAWGINVQVPWFDRYHTTFAEGDSDLSSSQSNSIGDIRVTARYQGFAPQAKYGVLLGMKLPTGSTNVNFRSGPQGGNLLDRGLQPGTGTIDALLGVYNSGSLGQSVGYYAQALLQQPLNSDGGFRPGTGINISAGLRYLGSSRVTPQLQFNLRAEQRESGVNADVDNSGATLGYLSPGIDFRLNAHWDGFMFIQLPIYQRVNGLQLEPKRLFSMGLQYRM